MRAPFGGGERMKARHQSSSYRVGATEWPSLNWD
jgi:hypothetical protein